jgi:iron-sulfur cluster assembly protein
MTDNTSQMQNNDISLTEAAAAFITSEFAKKNLNGYAVRVGVEKGNEGCNDFKYLLGYVNEAFQSDKIFSDKGISIICDQNSFEVLKGIILDYENDGTSGKIRMINPNASHTCGCGEGFSQ